MKVSEMIELLQRLPQDLPVYINDRIVTLEFEAPTEGKFYGDNRTGLDLLIMDGDPLHPEIPRHILL